MKLLLLALELPFALFWSSPTSSPDQMAGWNNTSKLFLPK
jgi:hypothetical protein